MLRTIVFVAVTAWELHLVSTWGVQSLKTAAAVMHKVQLQQTDEQAAIDHISDVIDGKAQP